MEAITAYRDKLEKAIEKFPVVNGHLNEIEKKTKVKKIYIAYGKYKHGHSGPNS